MQFNNILVQLNDITVKFQQHMALQNVSLLVPRGKIITLIGPNGAGKSTLVRVVLGLLKPQAGDIYRQPGIRIGYMPQRLKIDPILPLTVTRFLTVGAYNRYVSPVGG